MSDLMFYGVLRMPYEMAMSDEISRLQFWNRAQEAARRVEEAEAKLAASATPAPQAAPSDTADKWRKLALQFDGHRMQALSHLRSMVSDPAKHAAIAVEFLAAAPAVAINQAATSEPVAVVLVNGNVQWNVSTYKIPANTNLYIGPAPVAHLSGTTPNTDARLLHVAEILNACKDIEPPQPGEHPDTYVLAIARKVELAVAALSAQQAGVQGAPSVLRQIIDKAESGACHGLLADGYCEEIAKIARAALAAGLSVDRAVFESWWEEFAATHEDWQYADSSALRWAAFQAGAALSASSEAPSEDAKDVERLVPAGWKLSSADFSIIASGGTKPGHVTLVLDSERKKAWLALSDEEREKADLYIYGTGSTFIEALTNAAALAAATQTEKPNGQ